MEEVSIIPSGYYGDSSDNIVVFENFIDPEDLEVAFRRFYPRLTNGKTEKRLNTMRTVSVFMTLPTGTTVCVVENYWAHRKNPVVYQTIDKYIQKMAGKVEEFFKVKVTSRPPVLMRWFEGIEQQPHADKELNDGRPNPFPTYDLNSLIYYNDDFTGGELYFPQHDIEITPKPGLAVMFVGDRNYLHGVRTVTKGERWTTPSFYTVIENLNEEYL